jgi:hypothetical protein
MHSDEFEELAGRIQALADVVCGLIATLDKEGVIDSLHIAKNVEALSERRQVSIAQESTRRTLHHLAEVMRAEHAARRSPRRR